MIAQAVGVVAVIVVAAAVVSADFHRDARRRKEEHVEVGHPFVRHDHPDFFEVNVGSERVARRVGDLDVKLVVGVATHVVDGKAQAAAGGIGQGGGEHEGRLGWGYGGQQP